MKSIIFVSLLVAAIAIPLAEAQLPIVNITGTVFCSANASVPGIILTPFPNAPLELRIGGGVMATTTTTVNGTFSFLLNITNTITTLPTSLVSSGTVAVTKPLLNCNATLGSLLGNLISHLRLGSIDLGSPVTINLVTVEFVLTL